MNHGPEHPTRRDSPAKNSIIAVFGLATILLIVTGGYAEMQGSSLSEMPLWYQAIGLGPYVVVGGLILLFAVGMLLRDLFTNG